MGIAAKTADWGGTARAGLQGLGHSDLVFDISGQVTLLNLGRALAAGEPAEIGSNDDVIQADLGN